MKRHQIGTVHQSRPVSLITVSISGLSMSCGGGRPQGRTCADWQQTDKTTTRPRQLTGRTKLSPAPRHSAAQHPMRFLPRSGFEHPLQTVYPMSPAFIPQFHLIDLCTCAHNHRFGMSNDSFYKYCLTGFLFAHEHSIGYVAPSVQQFPHRHILQLKSYYSLF